MNVPLLALILACSSPSPEGPVGPEAAPASALATDVVEAGGGDGAATEVAGAADAEGGAPVLVVPAARDPRWANARCNDGTPFALTVSDAGSDTWVIKVAGGYFCDDDVTPCSDRKGRLTTAPRRDGVPIADGGRSSLERAGLFSRDPAVNPTFADANHVELHYCSSDLWLGDGTERLPTSGDPGGWWFSGRHNLVAGLEVLGELGLDDATDRVLVVGHSAGGMGVVGSFDALVRTLPRAAADGRLKVVLDGAWVPPQESLEGTPRANRWGPLHAGCSAALEARGEDPLRCVFGPVWYPFVRDGGVPVLVQQAGVDVTQVKVYGVRGPARTAAWRDNARASLDEVDWLYSGGGRYHVVSFEPRFGVAPAGQPSFRDVLGRFWAGEGPERVVFDYD